MQFDPAMLDRLRQTHSQQWLRHWTGRIDARLSGQDAGPAPTRLTAAAALVQLDLALPSPLAAWVEVDLAQTRDWLALALQAGAPWRDARGAALLQAGVGLGALWFMDPRLLPSPRMLQVRDSLALTVADLMRLPMAASYGMAVRADEAIRARCGPALKAVRGAGPADAATSLRNLQRLVFERSPAGDEDESDAPPEASEAALGFVRREQRLLAQAGLTDTGLARACMAGDLVLGLGRCVRLAAGALAPAAKGPMDRTAWLWEVIDGLAQNGQ